MIDLKAIDAEHQARIERFKKFESLMQQAGKFGDLQQQVNVWLVEVGKVVRNMNAADRALLPEEIRSEVVDYLPLVGAMARTINGIELNSLHHIANLMKPVRNDQA